MAVKLKEGLGDRLAVSKAVISEISNEAFKGVKKRSEGEVVLAHRREKAVNKYLILALKKLAIESHKINKLEEKSIDYWCNEDWENSNQVEADFKDFVKKLGKLFLGLTLSTSAMGKHLDIKELKQKEKQVNQILTKADDGNKYKLNIVEKKSGNTQYISFLMLLNGKQVGSIEFEGDPKTNVGDFSNIDVYFTPEGKSNEIIYKILTPALLKGLTERAE